MDNNNNSVESTKPPVTSASGGWGFGIWNNLVESVQKVNESLQNINIVEEIKKKSDAVVSIYKEDLKEFSNTILSDATNVISDQINTVKQMINEDDEYNIKDEESNIINVDKPTLQEDIKSSANKLFKSLSFFTSEPSSQADLQDYEQWCKSFGDIDSHSIEINTLLSGDESLKNLYLQYVPSKISHQQFWFKYFYKQYRLNKEEERRQFILQQVSATQAKEEEEEEIGWDDEDDDQKDKINNKDKDSENDSKSIITGISDLTVNTTTTTTTTSNNNNNNTNSEVEHIDSDDELDQEIQKKYLEEQHFKNEFPDSNHSEKFEHIENNSSSSPNINIANIKDHSSSDFEDFEEVSANSNGSAEEKPKKLDVPVGDDDDDEFGWE